MRLGIDASNLRGGGGITHLVEFLRAADPVAHGFEEIAVWAPDTTLAHLAPRPWLTLEHAPLLNRSLPFRMFWQLRRSADAAQRCDILFVPGGSYTGSFRPVVTMFRNMLPFEPAERRRYGVSWPRLRLALLRYIQEATFRRVDGIIVLTEHARGVLQRELGEIGRPLTLVPHGVDPAFTRPGDTVHPRREYSAAHPFTWLYVSTVDVYKHQWIVAEAIADLERNGVPVQLDLVGSAYAPALRRLQHVLARVDPRGAVIRYRGAVAHSSLPAYFHSADGFIFASSCENMPNIVLEAMAAGLPIACSNRAPMPDLLGDGAVFFDPESIVSVAEAVRRLIEDAPLRERLAQRARDRSREFTWTRCADRTLAFLAQTVATNGATPARRIPNTG